MHVEYLIKIGDLYLTDTGLAGGTRFGSRIEGLWGLQSNANQSKRVGFLGDVSIVQTIIDLKNKDFTIIHEVLPIDVVEDLTEIKRDQEEDEEAVTVILTNPHNSNFSHSLECNINFIEFGEMFDEYVFDVRIGLTSFGATA